jgi:hypothetical protein
MERDFYNEEFENLIREKTDQYKMYPSDKVWKGIHSSLHARRRRFVIGMSVLISGILMFAGKELIAPGKHPVAQKIADNISITPKTNAGVPLSEPDQPATPEELFKSPVAESSNIKEQHAQTLEEVIAFPVLGNPESIRQPAATVSQSSQIDIASTVETLPSASADLTLMMPKATVQNLQLETTAHRPNTDIAEQPVSSTIETSQKSNLANIHPDDKKQIDWLQERALQHLAPIKQHKLNWQLYFSPTVNYRKLSGGIYADSRSTVQNVPIALIHYGTANDFVDHTPAIGYEFGGSMVYQLTRNLSLKAGLQFNYTRYLIRAYSSTPELATIALNSYYGYFADSITGYTSVRNFSGKSKEYIQNRYFQISAPLGLEMRVFGNGKLQFNIGATIQPTYLLNRNSYLLTTDYTNYTKEASLFRKWNLNGGLEAFISYRIGNLRWQIGPQFRYQLFSTYTDNYPLKENLMEYGIKIGITKVSRK